jgi:signal transduction histidine kinase
VVPTSAPEDVGSLWLATLQRAMGRASHDVKDALNGVSVNLEVIRSRSARPDTPASAVAGFGESAAHQLDRLTSLIEAVLALGRAERTPVDVGATLRRVVTLCGASTSSDDATVSLVEDAGVGSTFSPLSADVVRLTLLAHLLELVVSPARGTALSDVTCTLSSSDDGVHVCFAADGRNAHSSDALAEIMRGAGVRWTDGKDLSLTFPRA